MGKSTQSKPAVTKPTPHNQPPESLRQASPRRIRNWVGIIYTFVSAIIILAGTYVAIRWAEGDFRMDQNADLLAKETGLLHATSIPKGAEVYIDGKLSSVTDNIIYLAPGEYEVVIQKDGYSPWRKNIKIEKALVSQTGATLYPYSPSLTSLTFTGVQLPLPSPDGNKILFYLDNASATNKNGLYVLDLAGSRSPQQISDNDPTFDLKTAQYLWSPDSTEILVAAAERTFLLSSNGFANLQSSPDVQLQLRTMISSWEEDLALREQQFATKIPPQALSTILENGANIFLSPDSTKIFYTATGSAAIAENLIPALPAPNSQPEIRQLTPGQMYIYDSYEDKNYSLGEAAATSSAKFLLTQPTKIVNNLLTPNKPSEITAHLQVNELEQTIANFSQYYGDLQTQTWRWMPDSTHLVGIVNQQIVILNYDGTNPTIIYSGPFYEDFVLPHPDNNSLLVLTTFNPESPHNLYAIELNK